MVHERRKLDLLALYFFLERLAIIILDHPPRNTNKAFKKNERYFQTRRQPSKGPKKWSNMEILWVKCMASLSTKPIICMFSKGLLVKGYKGPIQSVINCLRNCFCNSSIVYEIVLTIVQKFEQLF